MSKRVSRAKRREQRELGVYEPVRRVPDSARAAERRASESAQSARIAAAREEIAAEEAADSARPAPEKRRDRTVLVLVALTALAGLIFWLTQRTPAKNEAKIDANAIPATSATAP